MRSFFIWAVVIKYDRIFVYKNIELCVMKQHSFEKFINKEKGSKKKEAVRQEKRKWKDERNKKYEERNTKYEIRNAKSEIQNPNNENNIQ